MPLLGYREVDRGPALTKPLSRFCLSPYSVLAPGRAWSLWRLCPAQWKGTGPWGRSRIAQKKGQGQAWRVGRGIPRGREDKREGGREGPGRAWAPGRCGCPQGDFRVLRVVGPGHPGGGKGEVSWGQGPGALNARPKPLWHILQAMGSWEFFSRGQSWGRAVFPQARGVHDSWGRGAGGL